jgi:hypothetical protein
MCISVNGTQASPVASGPDTAFVESVVKNATGSYTITLKEKAKSNIVVTSVICLGGDHKIPAVFAVTPQAITIKLENRLGAASDADIVIQWQYFDQLSYFF